MVVEGTMEGVVEGVVEGVTKLYIHPKSSIGKLLFVFLPISSMLLDVVFSTYNTVIFAWRPTLTLAMQVIVVIKNLFLGTTHSLAGTLSRDGVKNNCCLSLQCRS